MLHDPELQNAANDPGPTQATSLAMFGERCSGLEYVEELIQLNFPHLKSTDEFGWAHGFINPGYMRDNTIYVAVIRNALDWVREFYTEPTQVGGWCKDASLSEFLRHEWSGTVRGRVLGKANRKLGLSRHAELMTERHPLTGARIRNVIEMRNLKIKSLLKLEKMTKNVAFIRYEDARDAPEEMMEQLQIRLGLPKCADFMGLEPDLPDTASLPELSEEDLAFIARELNLPQEDAFGYQYNLPA